MAEVYVGTIIGSSRMNALVGRRVATLNERLSVTIRRAAIDNGIKATVKGSKLEFFSIEGDEFTKLSNNSDMLVKMTAADLTSELSRVNGSYPARMDYATGEKYKADLRSAMAGALTVIGSDPVTKKTVDPNKTTSVALMVGKWRNDGGSTLMGGTVNGVFMSIPAATMSYGPAKFRNLAQIYITTDPNAEFSYDPKFTREDIRGGSSRRKGKIVVPVSDDDFNRLESIMDNCHGEQGRSAMLSLTLGNRNKDLVDTFIYEHDYL